MQAMQNLVLHFRNDKVYFKLQDNIKHVDADVQTAIDELVSFFYHNDPVNYCYSGIKTMQTVCNSKNTVNTIPFFVLPIYKDNIIVLEFAYLHQDFNPTPEFYQLVTNLGLALKNYEIKHWLIYGN